MADATLLKDTCHTAQSYEWLVALALHLEDTALLAGDLPSDNPPPPHPHPHPPPPFPLSLKNNPPF